jgi:hypothetical protein
MGCWIPNMVVSLVLIMALFISGKWNVNALQEQLPW